MEANINYEDYEKDILDVLYNNIGKRAFALKEISRRMKHPVKPKNLPHILLYLIEKNLISWTQKGNQIDKFYFITEQGVKYVENNYTKINNENYELKEITKELKQFNLNFTYYMDELLKKYKLSDEEEKRKEELLIELKSAIEETKQKDDNKALKVLKAAINTGKSIFIPLVIEYLKSEARLHGIF